MERTATSGRWHGVPLAAVGALWAAPTWLALMHLVTGSIVGVTGGVAILILVSTAAAGIPTVIVTIAALIAVFPSSAVLADLQRSRHTAFLRLRWPNAPSRPLTFAPRALVAYLRGPKTWRQLSYHLVASVYGPVSAVVAVAPWALGAAMVPAPLYWIGAGPGGPGHPWAVSGVGLAMLLVAPWATRGLAGLDAAMARRLLGTTRNEELALRVSDLAASRDSTVDAADAERRRIERDLHDGAQQRLTSLAMNLGIARATLTDASEPATRAIEQAHEEAKQALGELRDLVRGLHPAVLEDRGLDAALSAVAARSPVPVRLRVDMDRRVARDLEAVAYFVVSEALTNAARHASAEHASVEVALSDDLLRLAITDDGAGGADPDRGTGLRGLADRVRSVDGTFRLTSPAGGPTTVEVELPCAS
ncbi:sensor histidine kinase [Glycomyces sp. L485]|uniref:sensor histidine kinase n=1 Tax=Glycomyces sp. L485 TaxID=2909235 RepID=UPI001F4B567D|nr:sensor histidine kinase [Glycomyces sp. L485]MCH7229393.1 sensor histidine kinase [Glycomyces sp. L485]